MIGTLRHPLLLQEPVRTLDAGGGYATVWANVSLHPLVYAALETSTSSAAAQRFSQRHNAVTHRLRLRHRQDVTPDMRLMGTDVFYYIQSVRDPDGRGQWLDILAEARPA